MSLSRKLIIIGVGVGISFSQLESVFAQSKSPSEADSQEQQQKNNSLQLPTSPNQVKIQQVRSLSLKQALELAAQNNRDLQIAALTLERSRSALQQAQAALLPTFGVNGELRQVGDQERPGDIIFEPESASPTFLSGTVEANYNLFTLGKRSAQINAAQEQVKFEQLELTRIRQQTRLDVANAYYDLQEADEQVKINQAAVENARIGLRDAQLLEEGGTGSKLDTIRASVQLKNAEQDLTQAQTDRDLATDKLTRILGLPETIDVAAAEPVQTAGQWNRSLEESIILAFQNRAELKQQSIQRNISSQQRQIALAEVRPTVSLFANYQALSELSNKDADGYAAGARVAWNFFDGGTASAAAKQEDANVRIAETLFADTRSQIRWEIEQAYKNLMANAKNIETATAALEQAQEALELISFGYRRGATTQLEVNTAQNELTNAAGNRVKAILNYNRSLTSLKRAINDL
ncbi:MAG: TolC family protein [Pleurocapsa minor HA4230-MV1]|jgi:outer membrane protein TolC|nr:TolC family protein [Pleurocapsa minor HA4230-MV1]